MENPTVLLRGDPDQINVKGDDLNALLAGHMRGILHKRSNDHSVKVDVAIIPARTPSYGGVNIVIGERNFRVSFLTNGHRKMLDWKNQRGRVQRDLESWFGQSCVNVDIE